MDHFYETHPGIRIDHALKPGGRVPPYYDPLLAKVIAWGRDREQAISRLREALEKFCIEGVRTTIATGLRILVQPRFQKGEIDTAFFDGLIR